MSIIIHGMEMPKSCQDCRFCSGQADTDYGVCAWCDIDGNARDTYTMQDCPLVPVPPHGRCIDADAFLARNAYFADREFVNPKCDDTLKDLVDAAETIIPADPADKDGT